MSRLCFKKGCEFEVDYACECLSPQTYWCQFHLGEHLKLSNRTHAFDTIITKPSQDINDSILDFLEKEKSKIEKLKEIALASLSPNLYNSKKGIEETFKNFDYNLKEINGLIKKITKSLKKSKNFNIKELNSSELYNANLCFILNQLRAKRNKILKSVNSGPNAERDFRRTCWLYENCSSDPSLCQAYREYVEAHDKLTSLYFIGEEDREKANLYIYSTESESEEVKEIQNDKRDGSARIAQLPNGELFWFSTSGKVSIIDRNYNIRKLPPWKAEWWLSSVIYFNRSIYCFGWLNNYDFRSVSIRFDLEKNEWFKLHQMRGKSCTCNSVIFNGNILIAGDKISNLLIYSINIDSFSDIPYDFKKDNLKILTKGEKRLYLIQSHPGSIFESNVDDEYIWKRIARSIIHVDSIESVQMGCSYNKGGIYISIIENSHARLYYKFDLAQKVLIENAYYSNKAFAKRSSSKYRDIECYSETLKVDPDDAIAYINEGHSLTDLGRLLADIDSKNETLKLNPTLDRAYTEKAIALRRLGKNLEAIECLNQLIELDPRNWGTYFHKAQALFWESRIDEAIDCYNKCIEMDPNNMYAYSCKGKVLCLSKSYFEAIECCNEAIRLTPYFDKDWLCKNWLCKADALSSLGRKSEALKCYDSLNRYPDELDFYFYKCKLLLELGKDIEVIKCYNEAPMSFTWPKLSMLKGKALSRLGRNVEKNECYKNVINNFSNDASIDFREAFIECDLETKIEAIKFYNKEIKNDPFHTVAHIRKGYALYHLDRKIKAIQCYNKLFKTDPQNKIKHVKDILDFSNYCKLFENKIENAEVGTMNEEDLHFLDWIIELIERYSEEIGMKSHYAYAYALKGYTLHLAGKYLEEIECYDKAIAINPDDANIYFVRYDALDKADNAIEAIESNN